MQSQSRYLKADDGGEEAPTDDAGEEDDDAGGLFSGDKKAGDLLTALPGQESSDDSEEEKEPTTLSIDDEEAPIKAQRQIHNAFGEKIKKSRKVTSGPSSTHMPDFVKMTSTGKYRDLL